VIQFKELKNMTKSKKGDIQISIKPTLNRAILYTAYPLGTEYPLQFSVLYHKQTTALQLQVDSNNNLIKEGKLIVNMYRNLDKCSFCNIFFNVDSYTTDTCDYRGKFSGVRKTFQKHLIQFAKEKYDFNVQETGKPAKNYMLLLGWKIHGIENDLNFFYIQRKSYNTVSRINIIRSVCVQFSTDRGLNILDRYKNKSDNEVRKVNDEDDAPEFEEKNNKDLNFFEE
jgi:hypothetical protein